MRRLTPAAIESGRRREALRCARGRVIAIDGGVYEGGRILLTRLGECALRSV